MAHLMAVALPPLSLQTRGPLGQSPAVATLISPFEGYSQFLYIDRGYAFFAPDPGPSHLIQAAVTPASGQREEVMYPDLQRQWPRLLYHRHLMLAEFLETIYQPPGPPQELVELDPIEADLWVRNRARYEYVRQSVVDHLRHENPGKDVAVRRIEHLIPGLVEYRNDPIELTDPRLYRVLLDRPIVLDDGRDLIAPVGPPEAIPAPSGAAAERASLARQDAGGDGSEDLPAVAEDLRTVSKPAIDVEADDPGGGSE